MSGVKPDPPSKAHVGVGRALRPTTMNKVAFTTAVNMPNLDLIWQDMIHLK